MMSTVTRPVVAGRVTGLRALGHPTPPLAGVLGTVSAALAVSALVLVTTADGWGLPIAHEVPVDAAIGIAYAGAAVLVLAGSGGHRLGWLLLVIDLAVPVLQVRDIPAGTPVGYGATWTAARPSRIATVAAGYADGYLRSLSGQATARFNSRDVPLVGRVSMDLTTFDVLPPLN